MVPNEAAEETRYTYRLRVSPTAGRALIAEDLAVRRAIRPREPEIPA